MVESNYKNLTPQSLSCQENLYGFCPFCNSPVEARERRIDGNDICTNKHCYPSSLSWKFLEASSANEIGVPCCSGMQTFRKCTDNKYRCTHCGKAN